MHVDTTDGSRRTVSPTGRSHRFDSRPLLVFWETTRACALACTHCRADAQEAAGCDELSTDQGMALIDDLAGLGSPRPILVLTGGDCMSRDDLVELAAHAKRRRVPVAVAPSVTPKLTSTRLQGLRRQGVKTVSLSLDGACPQTHDSVRGIEGHFDDTLRAIGKLQRNGFTVQVNTTVMRSNLAELADIAALMRQADVCAWELFFLITTGRGTEAQATTAAENEDVCHFLVDASRFGFTVRTVEAPFFRRVTRERTELHPAASPNAGPLYHELHSRLVELLGDPIGPPRAPSAATRDGKGIVFVAANGDVYPSGFMPLRLGNVRDTSLPAIYRDDPVLRAIRDADFHGACGSCDAAELCGGSRARAYASFGDPLGSDPGCLRSGHDSAGTFGDLASTSATVAG